MRLNTNFRDLLKEFESFAVEYVVIGGYAVMAHGHIRNTDDIDLFVSATPENADRIVRALNAFGLNGESLRGDLQTPRNVLRFGSRPQQVDILTSILGLEFPQVWANKIVRHIDGVDVKVISRDDLVLSKRAAGRHRDLADLEALGIDLLSPPPAPSASA